MSNENHTNDNNLVLERICRVYDIEFTRGWQVRLAEKINLTDNSIISNWKKRGVPNEVILSIAYENNICIEWILTGKGDRYLPRQQRPEQAREAPGEHTRQPLSADELNLIKLYRQLYPAEKEKVFEIAELYNSANESRRNAGGGSALRESNSR